MGRCFIIRQLTPKKAGKSHLQTFSFTTFTKFELIISYLFLFVKVVNVVKAF